MTGRWVHELQQQTDEHLPRPEFRDELRAMLSSTWTPGATVERRRVRAFGPRGLTAAAAAVLVAALVAGLVVANRSERPVGTHLSPSSGDSSVPPGPAVSTVPPDSASPSDMTMPADTTVPLDTSTAANASFPPSTTLPDDAGSISGTVVDLPVALGEWPEQSTAAPGINEVPAMLPAISVPGGVDVTRFEYEQSEPGLYDYTQAWIATDAKSVIMITTNLRQGVLTPQESRLPLDTTGWSQPWEEAFTTPTAPPYAGLTLSSPDGFVTIWAAGIDPAVVLDIARSLQRRPLPMPGWDAPGIPPSFIAYGAGGDSPAASRSLLWRTSDGQIIAELGIATEWVSSVTSGWQPDAAAEIVDLTGVPAVVTEIPGRVAFAWRVDDDTFALFGYAGGRADAEQIFRSLAPVDDSTWNAAGHPPDPSEDGCRSLFC